MMRLGDLIEALDRLAENLPGGHDAEIVLGVCDTRGLTVTPRMEVAAFTRIPAGGGRPAPAGLIRVHLHGDDLVYLRGIADGVDQDAAG